MKCVCRATCRLPTRAVHPHSAMLAGDLLERFMRAQRVEIKEEQLRGVDVVVTKAVGDGGVVGCAIADVGIVIIQRQEVDGNGVVDGGACVQRNAVDRERGDDVVGWGVGTRLGGVVGVNVVGSGEGASVHGFVVGCFASRC